MQLAHLVVHLNAEIERLQKARDLLALSSSSTKIFHDFDTVLAVRPRSLQPELEKGAKKKENKPRAINFVSSGPGADLSKVSTATVRTRIKTQHVVMPEDESRVGRRKRLVSPDTALRGSVPSGPVVVSAEEVRKSQASKTAQTTRAAEVRQAGAQLPPSFHWRSRTTDGRSVDLLLQRLMSIGESTDQSQLPSLGQSKGFEAAAHVAAGSKLD